MTEEDPIRSSIRAALKKYYLYLEGPVPSDMLHGSPDFNEVDYLVEEAATAFQQHTTKANKKYWAEGYHKGAEISAEREAAIRLDELEKVRRFVSDCTPTDGTILLYLNAAINTLQSPHNRKEKEQ